MKILTPNAEELDIRHFIDDTRDIDDIYDKSNIDAILQVSVSANYELYEKIRRETTMCEALRELMKDEIQKDIDQAVDNAVVNARFDDGMSISEIAIKSNITEDCVKKILKESGKI